MRPLLQGGGHECGVGRASSAGAYREIEGAGDCLLQGVRSLGGGVVLVAGVHSRDVMGTDGERRKIEQCDAVRHGGVPSVAPALMKVTVPVSLVVPCSVAWSTIAAPEVTLVLDEVSASCVDADAEPPQPAMLKTARPVERPGKLLFRLRTGSAICLL